MYMYELTNQLWRGKCQLIQQSLNKAQNAVNLLRNNLLYYT